MSESNKEGWTISPTSLAVLVTAAFVPTILLLAVTGFLVYPLRGEMEGARQSVNTLTATVKRLESTLAEEMSHREIFLKVLVLKPDIDRALAHEIADSIHHHAKQHDVDPDLVIAICRGESNFGKDEVSPQGAVGLMQLLPGWLKVYEDPCDLKEVDCNIRNGVRLFKSYIDHYNGDVQKALLVYNRGTNPVDIALSRGYDPGNGYVESILGFYDKLKGLR